jgi:hypothetical protein
MVTAGINCNLLLKTVMNSYSTAKYYYLKSKRLYSIRYLKYVNYLYIYISREITNFPVIRRHLKIIGTAMVT